MKRTEAFLLVLAGLLCFASTVRGQSSAASRDEGPGSGDYVWNEMQAEKLQALRAKGDALRGEISFEICQGCHRAGALGRVDGSYPRLAGQHDTVLIKQMTDVRAGRRHNPRMLPFADKHVLGAQDIADLAAFLKALPVPPDNGKGPGKDLARGRSLYEKDCAVCHGDRGEGDGDKFYPRVSGQHFKYLLREMQEIQSGQRLNANPKMMRVIRPYVNADMEAVADYMSRLALP